jgi:hypothetical protein
MAKYFDVHPDNPQPRAIGRAVGLIEAGGARTGLFVFRDGGEPDLRCLSSA